MVPLRGESGHSLYWLSRAWKPIGRVVTTAELAPGRKELMVQGFSSFLDRKSTTSALSSCLCFWNFCGSTEFLGLNICHVPCYSVTLPHHGMTSNDRRAAEGMVKWSDGWECMTAWYSYWNIVTFFPCCYMSHFCCLPTTAALRAEFHVDGSTVVRLFGCHNGLETIWNCDISHAIAHKETKGTNVVLNDSVKRGRHFWGSLSFIQKGDTFY